MISPKYEKQPAKRRSIGDQSKAQVNARRAGVFERDGYQCVARSIGGCSGQLTVQHRCAKGMGSSALFNGEGFLLTICLGHNIREMQDADMRRTFIRNGWSVARWMVDPDVLTGRPRYEISEIPVLYPGGVWMRNYNTKHFAQSVDVDGAWQMVKLGIRKEDAF